MGLRALLLTVLFASSTAVASGLPELGDVSQASLSPMQERQLGESIMREIRADPS